MARNYTDTLTGIEIDGEYGIPVESISCPRCGKSYKSRRKVCKGCEECKKCCTCKSPEIVSAREMIEIVIDMEY